MSVDSRTKSDLNYLKAFAAFLVVLGHCLSYASDRMDVPMYAAVLEDMIYQVHVPMFFTISGFLCHSQPLRCFYRKKFFRVLVPFWFFAFLKLLYSGLISDNYASSQSIAAQLWDSFVIGQGYWFSYAIFLVFLLSPLFWEKDETAVPRKAILGIIVLVAYNVITSSLGLSLLPQIFQIKNAAKYMPFFLSGMVIRYYYPRFKELFSKRHTLVMCIAVAVAVVSACAFIFDANIDSYLRKFVTSYALMILLLRLAGAIPENNHVLTLAGGLSYQIMLFDPLYKVLLFAAASRVFGVSLPVALAIAVFDVLLGLLSCRIAKRVPIIKTLVGVQ